MLEFNEDKMSLKRNIFVFSSAIVCTGYLVSLSITESNDNHRLESTHIDTQTSNTHSEKVITKESPSTQGSLVASLNSGVSAQQPLDALPNSESDAIEQSKSKLLSNDVGTRITGMKQLLTLSPADAAEGVFQLFDRLQEDPKVQGAIAMAILSLADADSVLSNKDLYEIYNVSDIPNLQGRAARVLAYRGEEDLLKAHIETYSANMETMNIENKLTALKRLGTLQTKLAVPHIQKLLSDNDEKVRLTALQALMYSGNSEEIALVQPMIYDTSEDIRTQAAYVEHYFLEKGDDLPIPKDILIGRTLLSEQEEEPYRQI